MKSGTTGLIRGRLVRYACILGVSAAIGAAYGMRVGSAPAVAVNALIGAINGMLIAGCIAGIEMFASASALMHRLMAQPFLVAVIVKTIVYAVIAASILMIGPAERLAGTTPTHDITALARTVGFSLAVTFAFVVTLHAAGLVGYRTFSYLLIGKYHAPRREQRFFLFADIVGSTTLAERVGPLEAHRFLASVFTTVAAPIAEHRGEIYQYVGDEIVVTWTAAEGSRDAHPLACFFAMCEALARNAAGFASRFGTTPQLRAALHFGEVVAGEVGEERRAIVFHGDVMNATARLEQATREVGHRFIASAAALQALGTSDGFTIHDLGELPLRGRAEPLHAFGIERTGAN